MQLVFEFGSIEPRPVVETIRQIIGNVGCVIEMLAKDGDTYELTTDTFASAVDRLEREEIASMILRPQVGPVRYVLLTCPFFQGQKLGLFFGTVEFTDTDYRSLWHLILAVPGLTVACLGFEEGVELTDSSLHPNSFPWSAWPLVVGAVRQTGTDPWTAREGPEIKQFETFS